MNNAYNESKWVIWVGWNINQREKNIERNACNKFHTINYLKGVTAKMSPNEFTSKMKIHIFVGSVNVSNV